ncbi:CHASE2 domain-containing protein [bacterium]|nr:CHASE2 domain-containing protein [bacterium]
MKRFKGSFFKKYTVLFLSLLCALVIWFFGMIGAFSLTDPIIYNELVKLSPERSQASDVLLVETEYDNGLEDGKKWVELVETLRNLEARMIVFTVLPPANAVEFYDFAAGSDDIVLGRQVHESLRDPGIFEVAKLPASAVNVKEAVVSMPYYEYGVARRQPLRVVYEGLYYSTVVAEAARTAGALGSELTDDMYLINFIGNPGIPRIAMKRVLEGELISDMVSGKTVLVGYKAGTSTAHIFAPVTRLLSPLQFKGYALNTLLSGKVIREAGSAVSLFLIVIFVLAVYYLCRVLDIRLAINSIFFLIVASVAGVWSLLIYGGIWLPVSEILLGQGLGAFLMLRNKSVVEERAANSILMELSVRLKKKMMPDSFYVSSEYWSQIVIMINQMLHLNRTMFLEIMPEGGRVREVKALHCSFDDIRERRRDIQREPYLQAVKEGAAIKLDERLFLVDADIDEEQYLVPLMFGGQHIGFWVLGIDAEVERGMPMFEMIINNFSVQLSELLYHRQQRYQQIKEEEAGQSDAIGVNYDRTHYELSKGVELLETKLQSLEMVFEGLETSVILYDLFGRVIQVNAMMTRILRDYEIAPFNMTALDLCAAVIGCDLGTVRQYLYEVIIEHRKVSLEAAKLNHNGHRYVLTMKPLICTSEGGAFRDSCTFDVYGILVELNEVARSAGEALLADSSQTKYSADIYHLLADAVTTARPQLDEKNVQVDFKKGMSLNNLPVEPGGMRELFETIVAIMVNDAVEDSIISISEELQGEQPVLVFSNNGFGIPDSVFQQYMRGDKVTGSGLFIRLYRARDRMMQWGIRVSGSSEAGQGTKFRIYMETSAGEL